MEREVLKPVSYKKISASSGVVDAFKAVDYSLEAAIADLIDNAVDAGAMTVVVRFVGTSTELESLWVADNGQGMSEKEIDSAMCFGKKRDYAPKDLGMYGMGMKSASLSQAEVMTVCTRHEGSPSGRQWTTDKAKENWSCGVIEESDIEAVLDGPWNDGFSIKQHGTVIVWDNVKRFNGAQGVVDKYLRENFKTIKTHLGLYMHRLIEKSKVRIELEFWNRETGNPGIREEVKPLNPFGYPKPGIKGYPKDIAFSVDGVKCMARCHVWPKGYVHHENYILNGNVALKQGLYFYRNDRLVQTGGWSGVSMDGEPHLSLARVEVNLDKNTERLVSVRYSKAGVDVQKAYIDALASSKFDGTKTFSDYIKEAKMLYRKKRPGKGKLFYPVRNMPRSAQAALNGIEIDNDRIPYEVVWRKLPPGCAFRVEVENRRLLLNKDFADEISAESARSLYALSAYLLAEPYFGAAKLHVSKQNLLYQYSQMIHKGMKNNETDN